MLLNVDAFLLLNFGAPYGALKFNRIILFDFGPPADASKSSRIILLVFSCPTRPSLFLSVFVLVPPARPANKNRRADGTRRGRGRRRPPTPARSPTKWIGANSPAAPRSLTTAGSSGRRRRFGSTRGSAPFSLAAGGQTSEVARVFKRVFFKGF